MCSPWATTNIHTTACTEMYVTRVCWMCRTAFNVCTGPLQRLGLLQGVLAFTDKPQNMYTQLYPDTQMQDVHAQQQATMSKSCRTCRAKSPQSWKQDGSLPHNGTCMQITACTITCDKVLWLFLQVLQQRITTLLEAGRNVVLVGDLNIAPHMLDHCDWCYKMAPSAKAQFLQHRPDRQWFQQILLEGGGPLNDVFRQFHSDRYMIVFTTAHGNVGVAVAPIESLSRLLMEMTMFWVAQKAWKFLMPVFYMLCSPSTCIRNYPSGVHMHLALAGMRQTSSRARTEVVKSFACVGQTVTGGHFCLLFAERLYIATPAHCI